MTKKRGLGLDAEHGHLVKHIEVEDSVQDGHSVSIMLQIFSAENV